MKRQLKCEDCSYFWWSDEYDRKMCMFPSDDPWPAPCDEEDIDRARELAEEEIRLEQEAINREYGEE